MLFIRQFSGAFHVQAFLQPVGETLLIFKLLRWINLDLLE